MSERYWITGVQIGMIKAFAQMNDPDKVQDIDNILDKVIEEQFMGNTNDLKVTKNGMQESKTHANNSQEYSREQQSKVDGSGKVELQKPALTPTSDTIHQENKKLLDNDYEVKG